MVRLFLLFEHASGYAIFERIEAEAIASSVDAVIESVSSFDKFRQALRLQAFLPFFSAENALDNMNAVSEGIMHDTLRQFLEKEIVPQKKKAALGICEEKLASSIQDNLGIQCKRDASILELFRGIRTHFAHFVKELQPGDVEKAQLGLGHRYSRCKVKFNVNRVDNMIIQSICLLDQLDKDLNTFSMRCREWYSWHFPELSRIVSDNLTFARVTKLIRNRNRLDEVEKEELEQVVNDETKAQQIIDAGKTSMGTDISDFDMTNIEHFADRVIHLTEYRHRLFAYLGKKMNDIAPNLSTLMGELVGARLISHSGSLTNLAKYPASTIQILGAEKALFRALKTRGKTPKYGLIFHSTFIGRAAPKNKGRISRFVANKASIASRIDCFSEKSTTIFGEKLKGQVEERLKYYETGEVPQKTMM